MKPKPTYQELENKIKELEKNKNSQSKTNNKEGSESKYKLLFENMTEAFALHKIVQDEQNMVIDYIFIETNKEFELQTGLKSDKILNTKVTEVLPGIENDPANWIETYGKVAISGVPLKFEQFSEPMGKWYSVLAYSPKEKYFATIFRDITKQKKSEQALLKAKEKAEEKEWEQKERVKELQGIISLGRLEEKYEEPDDIYTEFVNKVVPESMQFPDKVFISLKVNNQTYSNNKQTKSKNYLSAPIFVSKKQIGQLTVTYVDDSPFIEIFEQNIINAYAERLSKITERITAKKELEKQSLFVNTLLDNLKVGVVACDTDGKLTYFNKTTQEFHGLPQKEIGSENWAEYYDLYLADGKTKMQAKDIPLFKALDGERFNDVEMMIIPKQGKSYTLAASGSTIFDANGKKQGAVVSMYDISERKKVKQALKESEEKYRGIIDNMIDVFYKTDANGKITLISPSVTKLSGYSEDEILGKTISSLYAHPDERKVFIKELMKTGKIKNYFVELIRKGKSNLFAEINAQVTYKNGKYDGIEGVARDVTERIKAEQSLKESEEKYRLITENVSDVIWIFNVTRNKFTYTSPSVFKLTGYAAKESVHQSIKEKYSSESGKRAEEIIRIETRKFIKNPNINDIQINNFQQFCKNGSLIWIETSTKFHYNSANEIEIVGITRNIEDRKKAEQALKESEEKYRLITQNASDVIWILNVSQNKFTFISPSEIKTTGFTDKESVKQSVEEKFPIEFAKKAKEIIGIETQKFIKNPNSNDIQVNNFQQKCKDGSLIWVETSTNFRYNSANEIEIVGITRNIENRKKAEQALKKSETKLRESNQSKDKFFSIIAHDLKSPFNAMLGFSEILNTEFDKYDTDNQRKFIGIINTNLQNTYKLLENLLLWSRSQKGSIDFRPEKTNLYLLANETSQILRQSAENKSIELINQIVETIYIEVDIDMFSIIIRNLISNAIKFTAKGGKIIVKSDLITTEEKQEFVKISITDNGVGISKKIQSKLFDIGENISTTGTEKESGTGLGLILCKEFIEQHGGKIWVESEIGQGTIFYFTIPLNLQN